MIKNKKEITNIDKKVNECMKLLSSLHFWRRNQIHAKKENDFSEVKKSHEALKHLFELCDKRKIPFKIQNEVLFFAEKGVWFSDIKKGIYNDLTKVEVSYNEQAI